MNIADMDGGFFPIQVKHGFEAGCHYDLQFDDRGLISMQKAKIRPACAAYQNICCIHMQCMDPNKS